MCGEIELIGRATDLGSTGSVTLERLPMHRLRYPHMLPAPLKAGLKPHRPKREDEPGDAPMARAVDGIVERLTWLVYWSDEQRAALPARLQHMHPSPLDDSRQGLQRDGAAEGSRSDLKPFGARGRGRPLVTILHPTLLHSIGSGDHMTWGVVIPQKELEVLHGASRPARAVVPKRVRHSDT